ncbi:MAG TPA: outer membrane beta-barrel protein [Gemmatimonadales bacterium]|nr:outer membrane beta-barrel protein [Gemmatimonadales bacterium]
MRSKVFAAFAVASVAFAATASAQVAGLPRFNSGIGTGIGINADVGFPNADAGKGHTYGLTGSVALGPLGFTATVASNKPDGGTSDTWVGATANFKIFGGPLVPVTVNAQVGAGYASGLQGTTIKQLNVPFGLGIAVNIPSPALSIKPWIAPRMEYVRQEGGALPGTQTQTKFGLSAGVNLGLAGGLGIRVAYDMIKLNNISPSTFSVGVGYNIHVPGL